MSLIPFDSPFRHGFVRVAVASTVITIANPKANAFSIVQLMQDAEADHIQVLVTPELVKDIYAISFIDKAITHDAPPLSAFLSFFLSVLTVE